MRLGPLAGLAFAPASATLALAGRPAHSSIINGDDFFRPSLAGRPVSVAQRKRWLEEQTVAGVCFGGLPRAGLRGRRSSQVDRVGGRGS